MTTARRPKAAVPLFTDQWALEDPGMEAVMVSPDVATAVPGDDFIAQWSERDLMLRWFRSNEYRPPLTRVAAEVAARSAPGEAVAWVNILCVPKALRRQGLGRAMLAQGLSTLAARGVSRIFLSTAEAPAREREALEAFLGAQGFERTDEPQLWTRAIDAGLAAPARPAPRRRAPKA